MTDSVVGLVRQGDLEALRAAVDRDPRAAAASSDQAGISALLWAQYLRRDDMVQVLRAGRADLSLFEAAATGDSERVIEILERDTGAAREVSADGFTALHLAAYFGRLPVAVRLLAAGADPNAVAANGSRLRPLHSAAAGRSVEIARLLLDAGADVNALQEGGHTALGAAVQNGDSELVELLRSRGAKG